MRRIAVINQKGGVGKTTTTVHLGAALAVMGKRVLLIDLDPQAHLTLHFGVETSDERGSVYDVLTASAPIPDVSLHARENLTIVPSDIDLAAAESELISVPGREVLLREAVDAVDADFDFLLIDCPPSLGVLTLNALTACEEVLIPLQAQFLALQGLGKLLNTVSLVRQRINPKLRVSGVVLCMHEAATKLSTEVVDDLSTFLESARGSNVPWSTARIYETRIRRNIKLAEASSFGQTVFEYAEKSNGALDYALFAREVADGDVPTVAVRSIPLQDTTRHAAAAPDRTGKTTVQHMERNEFVGNGSKGNLRKVERRVVDARAPDERFSEAPVNAHRAVEAPEIPIPPIEVTVPRIDIPLGPREPITRRAAPTKIARSTEPGPAAAPTPPAQDAPLAERNGDPPRRVRRPKELPVTPA